MKKRTFEEVEFFSSSDESNADVDVSGVPQEYQEFKGQKGRLISLKADGNCLFRGLAYGLFGDESKFGEVKAILSKILSESNSQVQILLKLSDKKWGKLLAIAQA
jgi:hypothetical protein